MRWKAGEHGLSSADLRCSACGVGPQASHWKSPPISPTLRRARRSNQHGDNRMNRILASTVLGIAALGACPT
jgi:hypothetical protein